MDDYDIWFGLTGFTITFFLIGTGVFGLIALFTRKK